MIYLSYYGWFTHHHGCTNLHDTQYNWHDAIILLFYVIFMVRSLLHWFCVEMHVMIHNTLHLSRQLIPTRWIENYYSPPVIHTLPSAGIAIEKTALPKIDSSDIPGIGRYHHAIRAALSLCFSPHPLEHNLMNTLLGRQNRQVVPVHVMWFRGYVRPSRHHYKRHYMYHSCLLWTIHYLKDVSASPHMHSVVLRISCFDIGIRSCIGFH